MQFTPTIDGYEILDFIGEGGMGSVWRAVQTSTRRLVALKLLGSGIATSPRALSRFEREVELTARLEHANIARIFDSGVHRGTYFYAMELIDGLPLDAYTQKHQLSRHAIVRLIASICLAIQHAHARGIIHRDLKPANILVSADGQPHIVDFGVAKAVEESAGALTVSVDGAAAGTPMFMSPEQAAGRIKEIDTRSDVYSLGVIACRLLTGKSPHATNGTHMEMLRRITNEEIRRPRALNATIDRELEAVLLKAMAKTPALRYSSAGEFARDLENYLQRDPLIARPPTLAYFVRRRVSKYRWPLAIAGVVVGILVSMAVYASLRVAHERDIALRNAALAEKRLADGLLATGRGYLDSSQHAAARATYLEAWDLLDQLKMSHLPATYGLLEALIVSSMPLMGQDVPAINPGGLHSKAGIRQAAFLGSRTAASINNDGALELWDVATGIQLPCPDFRPDMKLNCLAVSRNGATLVTSGDDLAIRMWSPDGHVIHEIKAPTPVRLLSLSADAKRLITGEGNSVRLWDTGTGAQLQQFTITSAVRSLAISPDGKSVMVSPEQSDIVVFDAETGAQTDTFAFRPPLQYGPDFISYAPDGKTVAVTTGGILECIKLPSHEIIFDLTDYNVRVTGLSYSPDGSLVATSTSDGGIRLWDVKNKNLRMGFDGHHDLSTCVAWPKNMKRVLSGGSDGTLKVWDVGRKPDTPEGSGHLANISTLSPLPDGNLFLSGGWDGGVGLWDAHTRQCVSSWYWYQDNPKPPRIWTVAASPDGKTAACAGDDGLIRVWDITTNPKDTGPRVLSGHDGTVTAVQFSPDGQLLASAGIDKTVRIWNVASGTNLRTMNGHTDRARVVTFIGDGRTLLSGGLDRTLIQWDTSSGKQLLQMEGHNAMIASLAVTSDGRFAVSGGYDRRVGVWDISSGKNLYWLEGHHSEVLAVCCIPDTHIALTFGETLLVWNLDTGQRIGRLNRYVGRALVALPEKDGEHRLVITDAEKRFKIINVDRPAQYRLFAPQLAKARIALQGNPHDPDALKTFARWYAFRGANDWATDFYAEAGSAGAEIPHLELARVHLLSDRGTAARREFTQAMAAHEEREDYLAICLRSTEKASTAP